MRMISYIDQLKAETESANLRSEEAKLISRSPDSRVLCDVPLTDQIEALMRSLSPAQRNRPWSMDELVARLQGRYSDRPHAMNVGQALRAMGWVTRRDWSVQGAGRRVWLQDRE